MIFGARSIGAASRGLLRLRLPVYQTQAPFGTASTDDKVHLAVFGTGRMGEIHAHNISQSPVATLAYVVGMEMEHTEQLAGKYNTTPLFDGCHYDDSARALDDPSVAGVVIATSTTSHTELVKRACKAGKHVFVEQPVAESLADVDACFAAARNAGVELFCGFNRRYDPSISQVLSKVFEKRIGHRPEMIKMTCRNHVPKHFLGDSTSVLSVKLADIFVTLMCPQVELALALTNDFPVEVFATGSNNVAELRSSRRSGVIDTACVILRFQSGTFVSIDASLRTEYGYDERLEVFGSKGMVEALSQPKTSVLVTTSEGRMADVMRSSFEDRYAESFRIEMEHFIKKVRGEEYSYKDIPPPTHRQCRDTARVLAVIKQSFQEGRNIKLPR